MSALESRASFRARALEIGMQSDFVDLLVKSGIDSFGRLAFVCPSVAGSSDDRPLITAIEARISRSLKDAEVPDLRRLFFESHTLALADMRSRVERTGADTPREVPAAERMSRLQEQKSRLSSVIFNEHTEPAHCLADKIQSMLESGSLTYLPPNKCPSRSMEIASDRPQPQITLDGHGMIKVTKAALALDCDVRGELRMREAFLRRSLAFDQARLMSFIVQEAWHDSLFRTITREPPAGHLYVNISQLLSADRELWALLAQHSRGSLSPAPGAAPPLDALMAKYQHDPQVQICITPLPGARASASTSPAHVEVFTPGKGNGKGPKGKGAGKGKKGSGKLLPAKRKFEDTPQPFSQRAQILQLLKQMPKDCV